MLASRVRHVARGRSHTPMVLSRARLMLRSQSSVAFVRCHGCQKSLDSGVSPLICGKCKGVAYCSAECQSRDWASNHGKECDNFARYMATDVNVSLATDGADEPSWLKAAMHHTCNQSYCSLLEQMGVHDNSAYRLLCGCQGAPSPYRALVEDIPGELVDSERTCSSTLSAAQRVHTWAEYYRARGVPLDSPIATLLSFPLTLYHIVADHLLVHHADRAHGDKPAVGTAARPLSVHYLGPEKELFLLPLFTKELALLLPDVHIHISMMGPVACELPHEPFSYDNGRVTASAYRGAYHLLALDEPTLFRDGKPDVVVALNAGLAAPGYNWSPSLQLVARKDVPFFFTDYSEYSAEKATAFAEARGLRLTAPVRLNPFRAPLRQGLVAGGSVGFPWVSNGFLAGFNQQ